MVEGLQNNAPTRNGDIYAAGSADNNSVACILKVDANGDSIWSQYYGRGRFHDLTVSLGGDIIAVGYTDEFAQFGSCDVLVVEINEDGQVVRQGIYGTQGSDDPLDIEPTRDGGYLIVGQIGLSRSLILKLMLIGSRNGCSRLTYLTAKRH
jgi:hypothetical protein